MMPAPKLLRAKVEKVTDVAVCFDERKIAITRIAVGTTPLA